MSKKFLSLLGVFVIVANAEELQPQLMSIAAEEAQIANIGANKYMMLYGLNNPLPVIQRWNTLQKHPQLTQEQVSQINQLEHQKQQILKKDTQVEH